MGPYHRRTLTATQRFPRNREQAGVGRPLEDFLDDVAAPEPCGRLAGPAPGGDGLDALLVQPGCQATERVPSRRVPLEEQANDACPRLDDHDGTRRVSAVADWQRAEQAS